MTEDYVSFETEKLLKEKGFDEECSCFYNNIDYGTPGLEVDGQLYYKNSALDDEEYAAPTLQMVMKWLREVHNIDIIINVSSKDESDDKRKYAYAIVSKRFIGTDNVNRTYEAACEAGIRYCLEKLI